MIHIYVGNRDETSLPYAIPKTMLCNRFQYFNKALSPNFSESKSGILHFPDDNKDGWSVLVYFLLHSHVPRFNGTLEPNDEHPDYAMALANAYVLADKYKLTTFQNEVMRAFIRSLR